MAYYSYYMHIMIRMDVTFELFNGVCLCRVKRGQVMRAIRQRGRGGWEIQARMHEGSFPTKRLNGSLGNIFLLGDCVIKVIAITIIYLYAIRS